MLDARFYPHILDEIIRETMTISPQTVRGVCRAWSKKTDRWAAQQVELALHAFS